MTVSPLAAHPGERGPVTRGLPSARVLVVGDVMLDQFLIGRVTRISPEAPVPIVQFEREENRIGGAANVAHNVAALGGQVDLVGLVGRGCRGNTARGRPRRTGHRHVGPRQDQSRPTTTKVRVVTDRHQQVARVDYERDEETSGAIETSLIERAIASCRRSRRDRRLRLSQGGRHQRPHGARVVCRADRTGPLLVDPKIPHLDYYRGATLVTPNHHEAEIAAHTRIRSRGRCRGGRPRVP